MNAQQGYYTGLPYNNTHIVLHQRRERTIGGEGVIGCLPTPF